MMNAIARQVLRFVCLCWPRVCALQSHPIEVPFGLWTRGSGRANTWACPHLHIVDILSLFLRESSSSSSLFYYVCLMTFSVIALVLSLIHI